MNVLGSYGALFGYNKRQNMNDVSVQLTHQRRH